MTADATAEHAATPGVAEGDVETDAYDDVIVELRRVLKLGRALTHRHLKSYDGVTPALFGVLTTLHRLGAMRTTTVAEMMQVDVSVASRQVGELEQQGLVERRRDPADARAWLVAVTESGTAAVRAVLDRQRAIARSVLADWDTDELHTFVTGLRRFGDDISRGAFDDAALTLDVEGRNV
jgi:DNA-binding MarR family transcriptional regulator